MAFHPCGRGLVVEPSLWPSLSAVLGVSFVVFAVLRCAVDLFPAASSLAWINPWHVEYFHMTASGPRDTIFRFCLPLAAGGLLVVDLMRSRVREWMHRQEGPQALGSALAALIVWTLFLFSFGRGVLMVHWLGVLAALLIAVRWTPARLRGRLEWALLALWVALFPWVLWSLSAGGRRWYAAPIFLGLAGLRVRGPFRSRRTAPRSILFLAAVVLALVVTKPYRAGDAALLARADSLDVIHIEMHLNNFLLGASSRLQDGKRLFEQVRPYYGIGWPVISLGLQRLGWSQDLRSYFSIGAACNAVYFALVLFLLYAFGRSAVWALALSVPEALWCRSGGGILLYPNLSSLRFIGVPLFFLALWHGRRGGRFVQAALCLLLGICWTLNPETGTALAGAFVTYHWSRWREAGPATRWRNAAAAALGVAVGALTVFSLALIVAGGHTGWSPARSLGSLLAFMSAFASGYGGIDFDRDPMPFITALFALIFLFRASIGGVSPSTKNDFRAALSVFILLWGGYYINRPVAPNLRAHLLAFSLFTLDALRCLPALGRAWRRQAGAAAGALWLATAAPLAIVVAPAIAVAGKQLFSDVRLPASVVATGTVGGVPIAAELASRLREAGREWRRNAVPGDPCILLTSHSVLLAALTCRSDLPFADSFAEVCTREDRRRLAEAIRASGAKRIFFESPLEPTSAVHRAYWNALRKDVSDRYVLRSRGRRLEVWTRVR